MSNTVVNFTQYILLALSLSILFLPLRLLGIVNTSYFSLMIGFAISLWIAGHFYFKKNGQGLSLTEYFIGFFPILLIPLAVSSDHPLNYVITDVVKPLAWIGIVGYFKTAKIDTRYYIIRIRSSALFLSICSFLMSSIVLFLVYSGGSIRASGGDIVTLFPLFYFLVTRDKLISFILILSLLFGGKVGPLFSLALVCLIYLSSRLKAKSLLWGGVIFLTAVVVVSNFNYEAWRTYLPFLSKFSVVFEGLLDFSDIELLDRNFLGGRLAEVLSSMAIYYDHPELLLTGPGVGYVFDLFRGGMIDKVGYHGVHLSPVSILTIYGGLYCAVFYYYMISLVIKSFIVFRNRNSDLKLIAAAFFLANFINSFTVYSIYSVLLFPLSIGLLMNKSIVQKL